MKHLFLLKVMLILPILVLLNETLIAQQINPKPDILCPGAGGSYSISSLMEGCNFTWTVVNGSFSPSGGGSISTDGNTISGANLTNVNVIWDNVAQQSDGTMPTGKLTLKTSGCTNYERGSRP